jgi:hypothetical protein
MSLSSLGITYYDTNNDLQYMHDTQGSTQRFAAMLDDFEPAVVALSTNYPPSTSGNEPPGIPSPSDTLKVTKWKSNGQWFWIETPKGNLDDAEWSALHTLRVNASQAVFPVDA